MPNFIYKARDNRGLAIKGVVKAADELSVANNLRSLGYRVVSIKRQSEAKIRFEGILQKLKKVPQQEIILFAQQLSAMLKSGLSITIALASIAEQVKSESLKKAIAGILQDIKSGGSFSEALSKHPRIFNELFVSMIKVGETAGILDQVLDRLALLNTQEFEMRTRIRSAMTYPIILVGVSIIVVSFLLVAIIPKFVTIFETYEARLPLPTQILLGISGLIRHLWYIILILLLASGLWLRRYIKTEKGRYHLDAFLLRAPLLGEFYLKVIVSRFSRTLGALVKSGVPILEALSVTEKTVTNVVVSGIVQNIRSAITEGQSLTEPFKASGIFPQMMIQMISLGEKSGRLDQMLTEVASYYDREVEHITKNITVALEPMLLLVMGTIVAFIALSVLLPIFNLIKVFRGGL